MKYRNLLLFSIFLILILVTIFKSYINHKRLYNNNLKCDGKIIELETFPNNIEVFVKYIFIVDNKQYTNKSSIACPKDKCFDILLKHITNIDMTVIYQKGNPGNSKMLFSNEEYKKYQVNPNTKQFKVIKLIDSLMNANK